MCVFYLAGLAQASFKQRVEGCCSRLPTGETELCQRNTTLCFSAPIIVKSCVHVHVLCTCLPSILLLFFRTSFTICSVEVNSETLKQCVFSNSSHLISITVVKSPCFTVSTLFFFNRQFTFAFFFYIQAEWMAALPAPSTRWCG